MSRISLAVSYVERGWPVFPCTPAKQPLTKRGYQDATLDAEVVKDHWVQHPDHCIGIATGNGFIVVDVDAHKAGGVEEFRDMCRRNGLPTTYTVRTGQGGTHLYFATDKPIRNSQHKIAPNVDVRGSGGYVIAAGSESIYGEYELVTDAPLAPLPTWIEEALRKPEVVEPSAAPTVDLSTLSEGQLAAYDESARKFYDLEVKRLEECREAAVSAGDWETQYQGPPWDATVYEVACTLIQIANSGWNTLTERDAYDVLMACAPRDEGFGDREILEKWNSARKTVGDKDRPVPVRSGGLFIELPEGYGVDPASFFEKGTGLNVVSLIQAVLDFGPLAIDNTENRAVWAYRDGVWRRAPFAVQDRCEVLLGTRYRPNHVATIEPALKSRLAREGRIITCEPIPEYVNLRNGMLHWRTGELREWSPDYFSTVQLPVAWNPSATCPAFDQFAKEVMADDAVEFLWEILGYMIYSGNPLQRAVLFHGDGGNGKGTLIRVIMALLGQQNVSEIALSDITEGKFEVAGLFGKIANLAGDIDPSYMRSTAKFKAITGEDTIEAQRKFQHPFSFRCWAVPLFSANKLWRSVDTTLGYRRRWLLVPFPNTFSTSSDLTPRLTTESEIQGVLVGALAGLQRLMARGDFDPPASAREAKDVFEIAGDQVREWLEDDPAIVSADPQDTSRFCGAQEVYATYKAWAESQGHAPVSGYEFKQRLVQQGYTIKKSGVIRVYGVQVDRLKRHQVSDFVIPSAN